MYTLNKEYIFVKTKLLTELKNSCDTIGITSNMQLTL